MYDKSATYLTLTHFMKLHYMLLDMHVTFYLGVSN